MVGIKVRAAVTLRLRLRLGFRLRLFGSALGFGYQGSAEVNVWHRTLWVIRGRTVVRKDRVQVMIR